jgi:hypothetical protein
MPRRDFVPLHNPTDDAVVEAVAVPVRALVDAPGG